MTTKYSTEFKRIREDAKLSQGELAKAAGMHRAYISSVECGSRHAFTVSRTAQLYWIMRDDNPWTSQDGRRLLALAAAERGIDAEALEECDLDGLEVVIAMVEAIPGLEPETLGNVRKLLK